MLTGLFIESGPTVQVKSARRRANVYADTDGSIEWEGPMAVMVNRLSASALRDGAKRRRRASASR